MWYTYFKEFLEIIYLLSGLVFIISVIIAIKHLKIATGQLKLLKNDLISKNKRAAVEKSMEYLNVFASSYISSIMEYRTKLTNDKDALNYDSSWGNDFEINDSIHFNVEKNDKFMRSVTAKGKAGATNIINELEYIAAAFVSGLADEELAFNPIADIYCDHVEFNYDVICFCRRDRKTSFSNTIALYKKWKNRSEELKLREEEKLLNSKLSKLSCDKQIDYIGKADAIEEGIKI